MIYTTKSFTGFYPIGVAAVVVAGSNQDAADKLNVALMERGLVGDAKAETMDMVPDVDGVVMILCDGNY